MADYEFPALPEWASWRVERNDLTVAVSITPGEHLAHRTVDFNGVPEEVFDARFRAVAMDVHHDFCAELERQRVNIQVGEKLERATKAWQRWLTENK